MGYWQSWYVHLDTQSYSTQCSRWTSNLLYNKPLHLMWSILWLKHYKHFKGWIASSVLSMDPCCDFFSEFLCFCVCYQVNHVINVAIIIYAYTHNHQPLNICFLFTFAGFSCDVIRSWRSCNECPQRTYSWHVDEEIISITETTW